MAVFTVYQDGNGPLRNGIKMTPKQYRQTRVNMGLTRVQLADLLDCGLRTVERCEAQGCSVIVMLAMERLAQIIEHEQHGCGAL